MIETELEALAASVEDVIRAVNDAGNDAGWRFCEAGLATMDWTSNEQPSGWGEQPLQDAYRTGALLWYLIADQAHAVSDLLRSGRPLALLSQGRALAEACARSWYLLAPGVAAAERVRRMVNDRLDALFEDWRQANANPSLDSDWQRVTRDRILNIAIERGLNVAREKGNAAAFIGKPRRPSSMALLGEMTGRWDFASLFYRTSSSIAHAGLHGLAKRLDFSPSGQEYRARFREISTVEAAADLSLPIIALLNASGALMDQTGWQATVFSVQTRELRSVLDTIMARHPTLPESH